MLRGRFLILLLHHQNDGLTNALLLAFGAKLMGESAHLEYWMDLEETLVEFLGYATDEVVTRLLKGA
eukprot:1104805-Amphidinium_carterae.1